jgi:hypothetical protein
MPHSVIRMLGMSQSLIRGCWFGYGIIAACVEWMTAKQATQAEPASSRDAIAFDGGMCITRARRIEAAARPEHGRDRELISADDPHEKVARLQHFCVIDFQCPSRLTRSSFSLAARAASRTETVTSTGGKECWFKRKDSRVSRLIRLRATAEPKTRVAMLNPNRGWLPLLARTDSEKKASLNFLPRRFTSRNSAG